MTPVFDENGQDEKTFAPIVLIDCRNTEWKDVRLSFSDWSGLESVAGSDDIDGFYLNGYGIQCLVMACRMKAGLNVEQDGIEYNSEGDTCFIHFAQLDDASRTAELLQPVLCDKTKLEEMVDIARKYGFED